MSDDNGNPLTWTSEHEKIMSLKIRIKILEKEKTQAMEKNQLLIEAMKDISVYLRLDTDPHYTLAVVVSPAQSLRNSAYAYEKKEAAILNFRHLLKEMEE